MRRTALWLAFTGCSGTALPIDEALDCEKPKPPEHPAAEGDLALVTVDGQARCNDGTPPVMYVRAATDPQHANDWVVFLEGGGSCNLEPTCEERWCGTGFYTAAKMSSSYATDHLQEGGILEDRSGNSLAGYNVVELNYCSSDQWLGDAPQPVELHGFRGSFTLWFQGHRIVLADLDALDAGATSDDGEVELPPLTEARTIVWSGLSAGASGALQHVDAVADRYPDARVVGVLDGWNSPDLDTFDDRDRSSAQDALANLWESGFLDAWSAYYDPSCKDDTGRCTAPYYTIGDAVQTPLLVRHDERDPTLSQFYGAFGVAIDDYAQAMVKTAREQEATFDDRSLLETECGIHVIATEEPYYTMKVSDGGSNGKAWSMAEAVNAFVDDGTYVTAVDGGTGQQSTCP